MIVFPDRQLLIMTPPHTASANLHLALCSPELGGIWVNGPTPDNSDIFDHHTTRCHCDWSEFRRAIVIRHPFSRAVGLWFHLVEWNRAHGYGCSDFAQFAQWLAEDNTVHLSWMYRCTLTRWLGGLDSDDCYWLAYETLAEDLERLLETPVILKPGHRKMRGTWDRYVAADHVVELLTRWASEDLRVFGYTIPKPPWKELGK